MLKSILYYLLLLTTSVRFIDMIYILAKDSTNLPVPVIVVTAAMILYGVVLAFYKFVGTVRMKQLVAFYAVQSGMIVFNLVYTAVFCPLQISFGETVLMGTFLDLIINGGLIFVGMRRMRNMQYAIPAGNGSMNV